MSESLLPCVEIGPDGKAEASVLWLHGLGADGHDFEPIVPLLGLDTKRVRFVFPHAPRIPVSINMGMVMPAWYDIRSPDLALEPDCAGIRRSADQIQALLEREHERGVPYERIVLAGFSQGGAIALHLGLRFPQRLAGLLALSAYLLLPEETATERRQENQDTEILMMHGTLDPMVACARGEQAAGQLKEWGYTVEWQSYPMEHQVIPEQLQTIGGWLKKRTAT